MIVETIPVEAVKISKILELDPVHVYWQNVGPGTGYVTIICYGSAWTAYFGAMSGRTIQKFFADADTSYLVTKMGNTPHLKARKQDDVYLGKIVRAVKRYLEGEEVMPV